MSFVNPTQVFRNPRAFFERRLNYPEMQSAGWIVLVLSIANLIEVLALYVNIPLVIRREYTAGLLIFMLINLSTPALLWLMLAIWIRIVGALVAGRSQHLRLYTILRFTGWGLIPAILTPLVWAAGRYAVYQDTTFQAYEVGPLIVLSILDQLESTREMMGQAGNDPTFQIAMVVGLVFLFVSGYIWTVAVEVITGMNRVRSAIVAFLPVLAFVAMKLTQVL